jgi:hypothetical protein
MSNNAELHPDDAWLVLSLKWSQGSEYLVWYRPEAKGYTIDLKQAGKYTEADARSHEEENVTAAVPFRLVVAMAITPVLVPAESRVVDELLEGRN